MTPFPSNDEPPSGHLPPVQPSAEAFLGRFFTDACWQVCVLGLDAMYRPVGNAARDLKRVAEHIRGLNSWQTSGFALDLTPRIPNGTGGFGLDGDFHSGRLPEPGTDRVPPADDGHAATSQGRREASPAGPLRVETAWEWGAHQPGPEPGTVSLREDRHPEDRNRLAGLERLTIEDGLAPGMSYVFSQGGDGAWFLTAVGDLATLAVRRLDATILLRYARRAVFRKLHDPGNAGTLDAALEAVDALEIATYFDTVSGTAIVLQVNPATRTAWCPLALHIETGESRTLLRHDP